MSPEPSRKRVTRSGSACQPFRLGASLVLASLLLTPALCPAQEDDEESVLMDLDGMDTKAVQELADGFLKDPQRFSTEVAIRVIVHPKLNDVLRATNIYEAIKRRVDSDHYEALAEHPLLQNPDSDFVVAALVIRLIGRTRNPEARETLVGALNSEHLPYRAAAAHAIGLFGDRSLLPRLQKEYEGLRARGKLSQNQEVADGLLLGMLLLGEVQHLPGLVSQNAAAAKAVAQTALTIANGYTPPPEKHLAMKRLPYLKERHLQLQRDLVEIAPLYPNEMSACIVDAADPDICDVLYRLLPQLVSEATPKAYIPAIKARCWDLRQLALDVLMEKRLAAEDAAAVRQALLDWLQGEDRVGKAWALRNAWALDPAQRRQVLLDALNNGGRWDRVEAIDVIRRFPDPELLQAAQDMASSTTDPDVQFHLARLLLAHAPAPVPSD
ncbi:MAG: HEAT repeat domain-containing protein [Planctomycetes bacterium]|nr:HEAT repeat domain-containing protein [Planctomycetota bacterium]